MSIFRNIVHGLEYGNEGKKSWTKCGTLIEKDGRFFVKMTHMPVHSEPDGIFFSVFDQDHNKDKEASQETSADNDDLDDDIPF